MEIIFATGNKGKIKEVQKVFADTNIKIKSLYDFGEVPEIIEDADTFEGNAKIKADTIFRMYKVPVIADDSGLEILQLNNEPGVFSARYAGEDCTYDDNNYKVIEELKNKPQPHRAKFICCAVYFDGKNYLSAVGELPGEMLRSYRGENGFGYDPIFQPEGFSTSLAEMSVEEKNSISHRGKAFAKLKEKILELK